MSATLIKNWERPGWRLWHERRSDGVWEITESAESVSSLILREYNAAWKHAHDRGLPPPPPPPVSEGAGRDESVIRVRRSERRLGGRWKEADGRVFEEDESGMVYAVDSRGERIVDPTFRRGRRPTNEPADE